MFLPPSQPSTGARWCRPTQCVWEGGNYLKRTPVLRTQYEELHDFFCIVLRVKNESLVTVETELRQVEASDPVDYILDLFKAIGDFTEKAHGRIHHTIDASLKEQRIFPVTSTVLGSTFESLKAGLGSDVWLIADRHHLRQSFEGVVPLLAFEVSEIGRIASVLSAMGLESRLLSKRVEDVAKIDGNSRLHPRYTAYLRRKAKFIVRYCFASTF